MVEKDFPTNAEVYNSRWYVERNMGDDTPIQAYSLRDDYERNAEWFPTKTIRDWKTVEKKDEYPNTQPYPTDYPRGSNNDLPNIQSPKDVGNYNIPKATDHHWGTQLRSDFVFDRSRG